MSTNSSSYANNNNNNKHDPPPEQSRATQADMDAEAKRRSAGRARAPASAPGVVSSAQPATSKPGRGSTGSSSAAAAATGRDLVERNLEDRDQLAKRRAAARGKRPARQSRELSPAPAVESAKMESAKMESAPVRKRKDEPPASNKRQEESDDEKEDYKQAAAVESAPYEQAAVVESAPVIAAVATVATVVSASNTSVPVAAGHEEADTDTFQLVEEGFADEEVEKALDDYDESNKQDDAAPEAAVTQADIEEADETVYPGAVLDAVVPGDDGAGGEIEAFVADTVVDATGVAVVMSEEEEEHFEQKRRKKYLCYGAIVLVIVAVSIVVPVVLLVGGKGETVTVEAPPSIAPSGAPSASPSAAPTTSLFSQMIVYLQNLPVTTAGVFANPASPQYKAALWISDKDTYLADNGLTYTDPKALQRYAAAVFYYATNGNNWKLCGQGSPSCGDTTWLKPDDECEWFSLSCTSTEDGGVDGVIDQINFPATGNDLMGAMPPEMSLFTSLLRFLTPENSLSGDLDVAFGELSTLETLAMPDNRLTGTIPTGILEKNPNLSMLNLGGNQFVGTIPEIIARSTRLSDLELRNNKLGGTIPSGIGELSLLVSLELQGNELAGEVPDSVFTLNKLASLSIRENTGINGTINTMIAQLTSLSVLQLGYTGIGGTIPNEMFLLTDLSEMNLEGAKFYGTIPENFRWLNASLMDLFLNDNAFTGSVPEAFDYLTALETLQIQGNQLTGSISQAVCAERGLRFQQLATLIVDCVVECSCCDNCEE